jgi:putative tryptophan/tyrosine transport system substrate-binding protein
MPVGQTNRRAFIAGLGGAAAWPVVARAQQPIIPVIGLLGSESPDEWAARIRAFQQGLADTGYIDGRNVAIEYRWADGHNDRLPALAADLVDRQVAVIAAPGSSPAALAAKAATSTIPIIFWIGGDAVQLGLVASLNRPQGNLTGVTTLNVVLGPKRLELLHELIPTTSALALLVNPTDPANVETITRDVQAAAGTLGLKLHVLNASTEHDLEVAFANVIRLQAGGLVVGTDAFFSGHLEQISELAIRHAVPTIYQFREFVAAGGLMSYGGNVIDAFRGVGVYTGRILNGEKPADLPVQQVTKVELYINLKTARTLGLNVPLVLLGRANEVIE